ncbi:TPA: TraK family protein [Legionella pneumophila]|jgi:hypothetical protein|uniref:Conjugal transfer protein TraK n=1 Tax=Legionella pneumophila TaxID=446 RepID=A0AAN5KTY4_LEGPN|nr:TraK family protein [Legionella pneumophila]HAT8831331.1 conjugal transfer protein TraK [Legionella pneumophila subsp. pneumophila]TIH02163.1 conjugal transfer protein TraK [Legionella pneumophila]HAT1597784.1 TraK family protein [Legionella pneumophila]HAT1971054.1 TraK family protein [Legionella pneumophila]HAT1991195.1 TraK family protein [Legionella pneumophila]
MNKSLTENLKSSNQAQQRANARKHKVEFLSLREDIADALEKGWSITIIWETLRNEGSFTATYNTFRLYVLKYIANGQKLGYSQKGAVDVQTKKLIGHHSSEKQETSMPSFRNNPIPNIKDLL